MGLLRVTCERFTELDRAPSCLAPSRSTLRMSIPMLQLTTASAVMAVSQSFTFSTRWPVGKFDHSRKKARVLAMIWGAKLLILILRTKAWTQPTLIQGSD